jgi:cytochrome c-type biogenesis protein CcmH
MISSLLVFVVLAALAMCFMIWPLLRFKASARARGGNLTAQTDLDDRLKANIQLFQEHMTELEATLAEGRIDAGQFAQLKLEQERNLLEDEANLRADYRGQHSKLGGVILTGICVFLLVVAVVLYQRWGSTPDVTLQALQAEKNQLDYQDAMNNREPDPERARELMSAIEARLVQRPESTQYWFMLARTAMEIGDYARAVTAYERILPLDPTASVVMGELAQAMFLRDKNRMNPAIAGLAQSAVQIDPQNTTALGLLGINAFEKKDFAAAADYWQRAVTILGPDAPGSRALLGGVERARNEAAAAGTPLEQPKATAGRQIPLQVVLGQGVDVSGDLPVFVYARAWQGARMPLAIQRISLADLPASLTLDESMAMSPAMTLAQAGQVEVVARIAMDGSATAKAGDWKGSICPLDLDNLPAEILITIDQKLSE